MDDTAFFFLEGISFNFRTGWTWRREAEDGTLPESDLLIDSMARCKSWERTWPTQLQCNRIRWKGSRMAARFGASMRWFSLCETMFHLIVLPSLNELQYDSWSASGEVMAPSETDFTSLLVKRLNLSIISSPDFDGFHSTKHGTQIHTSD